MAERRKEHCRASGNGANRSMPLPGVPRPWYRVHPRAMVCRAVHALDSSEAEDLRRRHTASAITRVRGR